MQVDTPSFDNTTKSDIDVLKVLSSTYVRLAPALTYEIDKT